MDDTDERSWGDLLAGVRLDTPAGLDELRKRRAVLMDRISAIDDLLAEYEPTH